MILGDGGGRGGEFDWFASGSSFRLGIKDLPQKRAELKGEKT